MLPMYKKQNQQNKQQVTEQGKNEDALNFRLDGNKINFISLGCPRNLVDSEVMLGILLQAGYEVAPYLEEADYIVINTCGFLEASRQESMDTVRETLAQRKEAAKIIVTGCMVQTHSSDLKKSFQKLTIYSAQEILREFYMRSNRLKKGK